MIFSASLIFPSSVAYYYSESDILNVFLSCSLVIFIIGLTLFVISSDKKEELRTKDGFLITVLFWGVLTIFGSFPIYFSEFKDISYIDSLFESVSGITTTGATVLMGLEEMPRSLLFYRQLIQWLGGMGIIVLAVAVLPLLGVGGMQLYKAEAAGPLKEAKLKPRITETAKTLWLIYLSITIVCAIFYRIFGMTTYDAICHAFSTVSIGGFSTHDESFGFYQQTAIRVTCMVFMVIAGINFALHYVSWHKKGFCTTSMTQKLGHIFSYFFSFS